MTFTEKNVAVSMPVWYTYIKGGERMSQTIGEKIREIRKARGLTQKELGEKAGIAEPTIRRYELGKLNPKIETVKKIADALGVDAAYLYSESVGDAVHDGLVSAGVLRQMVATSNTDILEESLELQRDFSILTKEGRAKALERVHELTEIPRYVEYPLDVRHTSAGPAADDAAEDEPKE